MGKTITTHNGSAAYREHNIRNPRVTGRQEHIDNSLGSKNEVLIDELPREAYKRIFGKALEDYNSKQTRPERQIKDYYSHIDADKVKHPVYEMIVQVGDKHDTGIDAPVERVVVKEFISGWSERNPNLELIGAYVHADERDGTLHAHLDYIPVAHGYKNGMHTQSALVKALGEQGFDTVKRAGMTAQIRWEARENKVLEDICLAHGIEVDHPKAGRKHLLTPEYKELMDELSEVQKKVGEKTQQLDELKMKAVNASRSVEKTQGSIKYLEIKKKGLQGQIDALESKREILTTEDVKGLKGTKTLLGGLKGVRYEEYEALRRTAKHVDKVGAERDVARDRAAAAEKWAVEIERKAKEAIIKTPSIQLQLENAKLKGQFGRMQQRLHMLLEKIPAKLNFVQDYIKNILQDTDPFAKQQQRPFR